MSETAGSRMIPMFFAACICPWHYFGIKSLWVTIFVRSRKWCSETKKEPPTRRPGALSVLWVRQR